MVTSRIYSEELPAGTNKQLAGTAVRKCLCGCAGVLTGMFAKKRGKNRRRKKRKEEGDYSVTFKVLISGSQPLI